MLLLFDYLVLIIYCFCLCFLSCVFCVVLSLVLFVIVSCPYPDSLASDPSQVSASVSPYLVARLVRLLRFTSSYRALSSCLTNPLELPPLRSSPLGLSGHLSCPHCVVCPAPLFGLIHSSLYLLFQVTVLSIKLQLSAQLHLGPISCRSLTDVGPH